MWANTPKFAVLLLERFKVAREGQIDIFLISLIFGWCNGSRPRNVLRKFETIWTSGSLVIAVCSLKQKKDFSNLQASFGLPRRKCTGKYNFQVSKLYVFFNGMIVRRVRNKFRHAPCYIGLRLQDLPQLARERRK